MRRVLVHLALAALLPLPAGLLSMPGPGLEWGSPRGGEELAQGAGGPQGVRLPNVVEQTLANGIRVLMVERPGLGAVRAEVFIKGGRANTGGLPPAAADLLARTLFRRTLPEGLEATLEPALEQEAGAFEALRLDRLAKARLPEGAPPSEIASLKALEEAALEGLRKPLRPLEAWDALDALGASSRDLGVSADCLFHGLDLPTRALPEWFRLEAQRLKHPPLARFPLERDRLVQELGAGAPPSPAALSVLLAMALSGRPYALAAEFHRSQVEALTWKDLEAYANWATAPENLTLVLVGDIKTALVMPQLEHAFGDLPKPAASQGRWEAAPVFQASDAVSSLESPGGRRLIVSTTGDTRVFFGWRLPPANHPDGSTLRVLCQILGGSPSARLNQNLVESRGLARRLSVRMGIPGRRDVNLLVIEAEPAEGHSLDELEQAIQGEVLRLQQEPLSEQEVRQAQVQLESAETLVQEDAATLAQALGTAQCQGGDWRLAFRALESNGRVQPTEVQRVARTYLVPPRMTVAQMGPDPLLMPLDRTENRLLQVLTALLQRRLGDPAQTQVVLREALRQMRMLSPAEREQTLKLLESQVNP
jgi:zinc protease